MNCSGKCIIGEYLHQTRNIQYMTVRLLRDISHKSLHVGPGIGPDIWQTLGEIKFLSIFNCKSPGCLLKWDNVNTTNSVLTNFHFQFVTIQDYRSLMHVSSCTRTSSLCCIYVDRSFTHTHTAAYRPLRRVSVFTVCVQF